MRFSESIKNISIALNKVIAEVRDVAKTEEGFGYKYASLDNILKMLRPLLAKNGLAMLQSQEVKDGEIVVKTLLTHTSGEWIEVTASAPFENLKGMNSFQVVGAGTTYLRRYSIANLFAIASEEDTDASPKQNPKSQQNQKDTQNQTWEQLGINFKQTENGLVAVETQKGAIYRNKELLKKAGFKWNNELKSWVKPA
jgi:hypothetical protein